VKSEKKKKKWISKLLIAF